MSWTRRDVLSLGLWSWAMTAAAPLARAATPRRRPRYFMLLLLPGGMDAIYTTDPKLRGELEDGCDAPYGQEGIVEAGGLLLGPHLKPLARWAPQMAVLNGVQVRTANHTTGTMQVPRLKTGVHKQMPTLLDIIGAHREGQPLGCVSLGRFDARNASLGWFGGPDRGYSRAGSSLWGELDDLEPADLERLAHVLRKEAEQMRDGLPEGNTSAENLEQAAALLDRLPNLPPFRPTPWAEERAAHVIGDELQRALWVLENDLASCVFQMVPLAWDTHAYNAQWQARASGTFFPLFDRFLEELNKRSNRYGPLAANTAIVATSELGRFPRLNSFEGKDHLPEAPALFFGPAFNTGGKGAAYGRTGRHMQALPLSLATGRPAPAGGELIELDDLGATLLHLAGIPAKPYGYFGRVLPFLEAA